MTTIKHIEKTCLIIKPDGVCKKHVGDIIKHLEDAGLNLIGIKMIKPSRQKLEEFYHIHKGKPFFEAFMNFMTSAPIIVTVWKGKDSVKTIRNIIGSTNSKEAKPGTLRNLYGTDNRRNLVHASDSPENANREIEFFFKPDELFEYNEKDWEDK